MRLIDADTLKKRIKESTADKSVKVLAEVLVNTAPTVDAEAVVRCEGCKHARKSEDAFDWDGVTHLCECNYSRQPNRWHEYCSYGEPKMNGGAENEQ